MRAIRRLLQVTALVGTLIVGVVALALIVSQTPWFRDWLRRYIVRESKLYLNGDLSIGGLGGNLLFGVQLSDIALDVSGERIVAVKDIELDYSVFRLVSSGVVLDNIKVNRPVLVLERDGEAWNLGQVVKAQRKEAEREGPGRPLSLQSIEVTDGAVSIRDNQPVGTTGYRLPKEISDLDVKATYEYAPVHYSMTMDHLSFRATSPELSVGALSGKLAVRDDNLYVEDLSIKTGETSLRVDGVVEQYLTTPNIKLTAKGDVSLPEIGRVVPAVAPYRLNPAIDVKADGTADHLGLDLNIRSQAGNLRGKVTADVKGPDMGAEGELDVQNLNLARIVGDDTERTDITGHGQLDLLLAGAPAQAPVLDRLKGTFSFAGPRVVAAGYQAQDVSTSGRIDGSRIWIDRGRATAYGGSATTSGFILVAAKGRPMSFDLRGKAENVNVARLPELVNAPKITTNLSVASYHVRGAGTNMEGEAELNRSTIEGATVDNGTIATFKLAPGAISYSAKGTVADLDLQRVGHALEIEALDTAEYASRIAGDFDVTGSVPRTPGRSKATRRETGSTLAEMTLDASGRLKDSEILGGRLPDLAFESHIANGTLNVRADGSFENFDPARVASRQQLEGTVSGTVNATFTIADLTAPITPETIAANGRVALTESSVGGLKIESAEIDAAYADQVGEVKTLAITGPDLKAEASGRVALDANSSSDLQYRVEATDVAELGRLAGQEGVGGSAIVQGTLTGNRSSLTTTGTLDGSNLSYQKNNALDLDTKYTVTVPDLDFARARVEAITETEFVKAGGLEINSIKATTTYEQKTITFTTSVKEQTRELDARGEVILHPDHQEVHLPELAIRTQGVEWRTKPGTSATIKYGQQRIEIEDVQLVSTDQSLGVAGTIITSGENPDATLDVKAENVDLQAAQTLLLQDRGLSGRVNANARLTGTLNAPTVEGHMEIRDGAFRKYTYESLVAQIGYAGQRVTVDAALTQTPTERISVKGSAPLSLFRRSETGEHVPAAAGDEVDVHIQSTALGLGFIQGLTDKVANVTGTFEADVRVTGSGEDPHVQGHIDIRNGAFGVPFGGVSFTGLNTRIDLTPDVVSIQSFNILDENGAALNVSGSLAVHAKSVGAVNINVTSKNFEIIDNEMGDIGLDTKVQVTGELRRPKVQGEVRVDTGRIEVNQVLALFYDPYATQALPDIASADRQAETTGSAAEATKEALARASEAPRGVPEAPVEAAAEPSVFDALEMDLHVVIPDNLVLRGNEIRPGGPNGAALGDMLITIGGDLQVRKAANDKVRLIGTVETVRGTYKFQGRSFELQRGGEIRFVGETEINPFIDITATRAIPNSGVEARVHIKGTAKHPTLELTSNPPLDQSDILALILFNRPVNELGTGERSSLAATAGGIATGFIAAPLGQSIAKALDLDLFEITTTTDQGDLGAGLTLGQQIGDRAFLKLRQQFGERNTIEFLVEYQIARFLRVQATGAPETTGAANRISQQRIEHAGIDLIFFFNY